MDIKDAWKNAAIFTYTPEDIANGKIGKLHQLLGCRPHEVDVAGRNLFEAVAFHCLDKAGYKKDDALSLLRDDINQIHAVRPDVSKGRILLDVLTRYIAYMAILDSPDRASQTALAVQILALETGGGESAMQHAKVCREYLAYVGDQARETYKLTPGNVRKISEKVRASFAP